MTAPAAGTPGDVADGDQEVRDVDPHDDGMFPVHPWRQAPPGLATRRQLRAMRLRPGGHEPVGRIECRGGKRWAWLYRVDLALPVRPMTMAKEIALDKAMAKRQTCGSCGRRYFYCLPLKTVGACLECAEGIVADPSTYTLPRASHHLAA